MLYVSVDRIKPSDITATAVAHPQRPGSFLLQKNVELKENIIARMKDMGLQGTWVHRAGFEKLDTQLGLHILARRTELFTYIRDSFASLAKRAVTKDDFERYSRAVASLVADLFESGGTGGIPAERLFTAPEELSLHTSQVAYLSVLTARYMQEYVLSQRGDGAISGPGELASLGAAAIFHDIYKITQDKSLQDMHEVSSASNDKHSSHPVEGFRMLSGKVNTLGGAVALQHHQRWDGQGWPDMTKLTKGRIEGTLSGSSIHIFARIVAAANYFDSLTADYISENGKIPPAVYSLYNMQLPENDGRFDPVVLNTFLTNVHPFPTSMEVVLSDGRSGGVIAQSGDPCRPIVLLDGAKELVRLEQCPNLHISQSQGFDVSQWLYAKPVVEEEAGV